MKPFFIYVEELHSPNNNATPFRSSNVGQFITIMRPMIIFGNCFGLMPLQNFWARDASKLTFSYRSWNFWYSFSMQICIFAFVFTSFYKQFVYRVEFDKIINFLSFTSSLLIYSNFVLVAKRWKELHQFWEHTEWLLASQIRAGYNKKILQRKIFFIAFVILGVAIVEQILDEITGYYRTHECWDVRNRLEAFFKQFFPEFFFIVPYSIGTGLFATFVHFFCMISRNFVDLFLIAVSLALREQFQIINDAILGTPLSAMEKNFWANKWHLYKRVHELLQCVNAKVNFLILLSYATNLYFICVQLLSCMRQKSSAVQGFYLWISLAFLIGRVLVLSLSAAQINDESKKILPFMRKLPTSMWNIDIERFLEHLTNETIALTGMNFFALTRSLILKIVSTIVTYELVLFQFKEVDETKSGGDKDPCT
ncbi:gustatory receptor for sugar taste 64e-like [Culicoides brevitarsis]|uniref:gustatory receptor for sugar taste 64e-like n=1 Tax=Culicoides brevitarsis TaxID=469753 RepID=UPI00307BA052